MATCTSRLQIFHFCLMYCNLYRGHSFVPIAAKWLASGTADDDEFCVYCQYDVYYGYRKWDHVLRWITKSRAPTKHSCCTRRWWTEIWHWIVSRSTFANANCCCSSQSEAKEGPGENRFRKIVFWFIHAIRKFLYEKLYPSISFAVAYILKSQSTNTILWQNPILIPSLALSLSPPQLQIPSIHLTTVILPDSLDGNILSIVFVLVMGPWISRFPRIRFCRRYAITGLRLRSNNNILKP